MKEKVYVWDYYDFEKISKKSYNLFDKKCCKEVKDFLESKIKNLKIKKLEMAYRDLFFVIYVDNYTKEIEKAFSKLNFFPVCTDFHENIYDAIEDAIVDYYEMKSMEEEVAEMLRK